MCVAALSATSAAADWEIRPAFVDLEPVFAECTQDPTVPNPYHSCQAVLDYAYTLRRSVAQALEACSEDNLADCAHYFDVLGVPNDPLEVAQEFRCIREFPNSGAISDLHCVEVISRLIETADLTSHHDPRIRCVGTLTECGDLQDIAESFWVNAVSATHGQLREVILANQNYGAERRATLLDDRYRLTVELAAIECELRVGDVINFEGAMAESECRTTFYAALWQTMYLNGL